MIYETVSVPSFILMGLTQLISGDPKKEPAEILHLWKRFFQEDILHQIPHGASKDVIAFYYDYDKASAPSYSLLLGLKVTHIEAIPAGLVVKKHPGGRYAKWKVIGKHPDTLWSTWKEIKESPLQRTFQGDFEVYGTGFMKSPQEVDLFIAIPPS